MARHHVFRIKRVYEPTSPDDGARFLVDGLWPRGLKKKDLQLDSWLKDVAPSAALRRWFNHDPAKWPEFLRRYTAELDTKPTALQPIVAAARRGAVTLLFGSRNETHNNAVALAHYLSTQKRVGGLRSRSKIG